MGEPVYEADYGLLCAEDILTAALSAVVLSRFVGMDTLCAGQIGSLRP